MNIQMPVTDILPVSGKCSRAVAERSVREVVIAAQMMVTLIMKSLRTGFTALIIAIRP